jgi:hypothetical protein
MRSSLNLHFFRIVFDIVCRNTIDAHSYVRRAWRDDVLCGHVAAVRSAGLGLSTHLFPAQSGSCGKHVLKGTDI